MSGRNKRIIAKFGSVAVWAAVFSFVLVVGGPVLAVNKDSTGLHATAGEAGLAGVGTNIYATIGGVINSLLGLIGVLFLIIVIYAGYLWMTASGNAEQAKKAKTMILQAALGLVVIFAAYALTDFVIGSVLSSTGQATSTTTPPS